MILPVRPALGQGATLRPSGRGAALAAALWLAGLGCSGSSRPGPSYPADTTRIAPGQQLENAPGWERNAVFYHLWVKAFQDGLYGDAIGDLPGVRCRLDHIQALGADAILLSPVFECAGKGDAMHGYDTTDYLAINDRFGRKSDLKDLLDAAHGRGIRVVFDFVPNHTSTLHPWFRDAATRGSWYLWKDTLPSGWTLPWGGGTSADVWKQNGGKFFYTAFSTDTLADLDWTSPSVQTTLQEVARTWLDAGFDGFRVDAARYLFETGPGQQADQATTHARFKAFRALLDEYATGDRHPHPGGDLSRHSAKVMIAEAWTDGVEGAAPYLGAGSDEFNLCLDFWQPWAISDTLGRPDATRLTTLWEAQQARFPAGAGALAFDSSHDNLISRPGTQYAGDRLRIVLAEALNLLGPNVPMIYYGNEVGMAGKSGNDADLRTAMDWGAVAAQSAQPDSILGWCKALIQARKACPALRGGYATLATDVGPSRALAFLRQAGDERVAIVANLTAAKATVTLTDLAAHGVPAAHAVSALLGDLKGRPALEGATYTVVDLPPRGFRVLYLTGAAFPGTFHGDPQ